MLSQRHGICLLVLCLCCAGSSPALAFHHKHKAQKSSAKSQKVRPGTASGLIHTQARFVYGGKVLATVDNASAVLYDSTDPAAREDVAAITGGRDGVRQAQRVCGAFVPGKDDTVGPGGDIYFDYVFRGDYWILVCAQVKFSGVAKPVWVSGTVPIGKDEFTEHNTWGYELPQPVQIVLDPYVDELKALPVELPSLVAAK